MISMVRGCGMASSSTRDIVLKVKVTKRVCLNITRGCFEEFHETRHNLPPWLNARHGIEHNGHCLKAQGHVACNRGCLGRIL